MKGQASLEFLMTYGWAFLALMVVVGSISYFALTKGSMFVPETCIAETTFVCSEAGAYDSTSNDYLRINLRNNIGRDIIIDSVYIRSFDAGSGECVLSSDEAYHLDSGKVKISDGVEIGVDGILKLQLDCEKNLNAGDSVKVDAEIGYKIDEEGYFPKTATLSATMKVAEE